LRNFSDDKVQRLTARLAELEREKEKHLPMFIEVMKKELLGLWSELHIPVPSAAEFPFAYSAPVNKRTLVALESEVHRLQNLREQVAPIISLIATREEILADHETLQANLMNSGRLTSRKASSATIVLEEQRIRKRYASKLPKVHAKLIPLLEEYEETFGEPFRWDGEIVLDAVREMHARETASALQTKVKQVKRGSPARAGSARASPTLLQRAPFQLQEYLY
jgi:hypothetical protein